VSVFGWVCFEKWEGAGQVKEVERRVRAFEKDEEETAAVLPRVERCGYPVLKAEMGLKYLK
jgi:hypothetical protein